MNDDDIDYDVPEAVQAAYRGASDGMQALWCAVVRQMFLKDPKGSAALAIAVKRGAKLRAVVGMGDTPGCDFEMRDADGEWRSIFTVHASRASEH